MTKNVNKIQMTTETIKMNSLKKLTNSFKTN